MSSTIQTWLPAGTFISSLEPGQPYADTGYIPDGHRLLAQAQIVGR